MCKRFCKVCCCAISEASEDTLKFSINRLVLLIFMLIFLHLFQPNSEVANHTILQPISSCSFVAFCVFLSAPFFNLLHSSDAYRMFMIWVCPSQRRAAKRFQLCAPWGLNPRVLVKQWVLSPPP
jgi:hypothetical protein